MKLLLLLFLVFYASARANDLIVSITEKDTTTETVFRVNAQSLKCTRIQTRQNRALPRIHKYTIVNWQLSAAGRRLTNATEILFQTTVDGNDFLVIRDEYNSWLGPLRLLVAFSGHPVQVSKIVVVKVASGRSIARKELTRKAASYHWSATISK